MMRANEYDILSHQFPDLEERIAELQSQNVNPLLAVVETGDPSALVLALSIPAIHAIAADDTGVTLITAVQMGNLDMVRLLLNNEGIRESLSDIGSEVLNEAVGGEHWNRFQPDWEVVDFLLAEGDRNLQESLENHGAEFLLPAVMAANRIDILNSLLRFSGVQSDASQEHNLLLRTLQQRMNDMNDPGHQDGVLFGMRELLLSVPEVFRGAERNEGGPEHNVWGSEFVHEFVIRRLHALAETQDIPAGNELLYFYILRNVIRNTYELPQFQEVLPALVALPWMREIIRNVGSNSQWARQYVYEERLDLPEDLPEDSPFISETGPEQLLFLAERVNNHLALHLLNEPDLQAHEEAFEHPDDEENSDEDSMDLDDIERRSGPGY